MGYERITTTTTTAAAAAATTTTTTTQRPIPAPVAVVKKPPQSLRARKL